MDRRFTMPENGNGVFWYSYKYGSAYIISISPEHDLSKSSNQYNWLKAELQSVDRSETPWLIVMSHRPLYEPEMILKELTTIEHIREEIEDLMHDFSVDLFLSGHYHSYFRSCSGLFQGECHNGGTQYVTVSTSRFCFKNPIYSTIP